MASSLANPHRSSDLHLALEPRPCPQCQFGYLQPRTSTYQSTLNGQLFSAFHLPAWRCDVCGFHEFDPSALAQIILITHGLAAPSEGEADAARSKLLPPTADPDAEVPPLRKFKP